MLTERENFLAYTKGSKAEWIPNYSTCVQYVGIPILEDPTDQMLMWMAEHNNEVPENFRARDCFGVMWHVNESGATPDASDILLEEIEDWREKVTFPDTENYDWDTARDQSIAWLEPDKVNLIFMPGPFMQLVDSMGMENAFIALLSEEDEVKAYLEKYTEFTISLIENVLSRQEIDYFILAEDMASAKNLFISPDTFRSVFAPLNKRICDTVKRVGPDIFLEFHICGYCEEIIDDIVALGVQSWQPAQVMNNIAAFQKRHGGKIGITGGWDNIRAFSDTSMTEEEIRQSVRNAFDTYAANDALYMFMNGEMSGSDPELIKRTEWVNDEARRYGKEYYQKYRV